MELFLNPNDGLGVPESNWNIIYPSSTTECEHFERFIRFIRPEQPACASGSALTDTARVSPL